jgi:futalosine hydrolase
MRILLVTATRMEIEPLARSFRLSRSATALADPSTGSGPAERASPARLEPALSGPHEIDILETGVGMVATAAWCSRVLASARYDMALNVGVCGSFDSAFGPGSIVHVVSDRIAELGAEDGEAFLTIQALELLGADEWPFSGGALVNEHPPEHPALRSLPAVRGITVNTVHGNERSIAATVDRFKPQVESMEGAAFMYACLIQGVPFAQVRAVSNMVERRNRGAWKMQEALSALARAAADILEHA